MLVTDDNFATVMNVLQGHQELAVDTETTGLNVRNKVDHLTGFCFSVSDIDCYIPFRHAKGINLDKRYWHHVEDLLITKDTIWHNLKFDMHSVTTLGWDPLKWRGKHYDTMIIAHLINEELYSKELDYLAKRFLNDSKKNGDQVHALGKIFGYENITPEAMAPYGGHDAQLTRRLKDLLYPELVKQDLEQVYWETEEPYIKLLYTLEQRGVGVNSGFAEQKSHIGRRRMGTIQREVGLNPASPKDLGKYLLDELNLPVVRHTKSCQKCKAGFAVTTHVGPPSFDKLAMEEYDDLLEFSGNPAAKRIAEYRGWQKAVTSLYEPILEKVGPDGLIRTEFKQHGTVTGRCSASNPNLQQIPRGSSKPWNGNAKSAFTSNRDNDWALYGWDYSQLELRIASAYGNEAILLAEFEKDEADPFAVLAPLIFGEFTADTRQWTKTFVYANLYGAGLAKIALQLGRTVEDTRPLYDNYKRSISGIIGVSNQVTRLVEQRGFVKYWDGRRRHIRNRSEAYKAWNSVCQGGGAQLVKRAMLRCAEFENPEEAYMVLQVHDEITFIIRRDLIPKYEPLIKHAMTDFPMFNVRLAVEGKEWK